MIFGLGLMVLTCGLLNKSLAFDMKLTKVKGGERKASANGPGRPHGVVRACQVGSVPLLLLKLEKCRTLALEAAVSDKQLTLRESSLV